MSESLARLVVTAVRVEGRPKAVVARDYRVSRQWVHELVRRFDEGGFEALSPRSRRPHDSPQRVAAWLEDEIIVLRKSLTDQGLDAGAHTIAHHLRTCMGQRRHPRRSGGSCPDAGS
jgi:transposase